MAVLTKFMVAVLITYFAILLEFWGRLFGESGESYGFLFEKNAHAEFPFNSRRAQSSEAHDEETV